MSNQAEILHTETRLAVEEPQDKGSDADMARHNLWHVGGRIRPPVDEASISMKKHRMRMDSFYVSHCDSEMPNGSDLSQYSRCCPIVVMRNSGLGKRFLGWSIILHFNWVKAFLIPLVTNGARAIGLRERHWIASESSLPYYPLDYPDCHAHVSYLTSKSDASQPPEGAVVCEPRLTDISPWTRQENGQMGLHMPQASVSSYFAEASSRKWQLQLPEDPSTPEFHGSPIGFVTMGFVHGSKKPLAIAYCEATSLAHLRKDPWYNVSEKRRKDETYVLIQNSKFLAPRLGLATIVLELHEEDLEFL